MTESCRVLVVAAHPEDAEIAMGMKIRSLVLQGATVRIHCLSDGRRRADVPKGQDVRTAEALAAGKILGVSEYTFSEVPDNQFTSHRTLINSVLFHVIREFRPTAVFTHFPKDQHLDHVITGEEVSVVASREVCNIFYFRSPYSLEFSPNFFFFSTPGLLAVKMAALSCFPSQAQLNIEVFGQLAGLAYYQHVHHRVLERISDQHASLRAEMFRIERLIEYVSDPQAVASEHSE